MCCSGYQAVNFNDVPTTRWQAKEGLPTERDQTCKSWTSLIKKENHDVKKFVRYINKAAAENGGASDSYVTEGMPCRSRRKLSRSTSLGVPSISTFIAWMGTLGENEGRL